MYSVTSSFFLDLLFVFLAFFVTLYYWVTKDFDYWSKQNVPHIKPLPFFGSILPIVRQKISIGKYLEYLYCESKKRKSGFLGFWVCEKPSLVISDLEIIKHILVKDFAHFSDRVVLNKSKRDPLGTNMILGLKHPHWKNMRSRLASLFSSAKIKNMFDNFAENAKNMEILLEKVLKNTDDNILDLRNIVGRYTADNIVQICLGLTGSCLSVDAQSALTGIGDSPVKKAAFAMTNDTRHRSLELTSLFLFPEISSWFNFTFFDGKASTFLRRLFWNAVDVRNKAGEKGKRGDLLDRLLNFKDEKMEVDGIKYDGDVLVSQFVVMFTAGFEPSSAAMALTLHHLAWNPHMQKKVRTEIAKVLSENKGVFTHESLMDMNYLDMVFKETLRLYPSLPFVDRLCISDYKVPGSDLVIKKGTKVYVSLSGLSLDPEYWPQPEKFDPERFSMENRENLVPFANIPFGVGPRICIGERIGINQSKLGLATILSKYWLDTIEGTKENVVLSTKSPLSTPATPLKLKLTYKPVDVNIPDF